MWLLLLLVLVASQEDDHDLAHIGGRIDTNWIVGDSGVGSYRESQYTPYEPLLQPGGVLTGYDYQVEPIYPTYGFVSPRYFANNKTGSARNCFRTIGGKTCDPTIRDQLAFKHRWIEVYYCFTGIADGLGIVKDLQPENGDVVLGAYVPRYNPYLGFDIPTVRDGGSGFDDKKATPDLVGYGPPSAESRLMAQLKSLGSSRFVTNATIEYLAFNERMILGQTPITANANFVNSGCDTARYVAWRRQFDQSFVSEEFNVPTGNQILKGDLQGEIIFQRTCCASVYDISMGGQHPPCPGDPGEKLCIQHITGCDACDYRPSDAKCGDNKKGLYWDDMTCLYGHSKYISFMSKCSLAEDQYSVRCMDPRHVEDYVKIWRSKSTTTDGILGVAGDLFESKQQIGTDGSVDYATYGGISTMGHLVFPSWNQNVQDMFFPGPTEGVNARKDYHFVSIRTLYPFHHILIYKQALIRSLSWTDTFATSLNAGRSSENSVMMDCPYPTRTGPDINSSAWCNSRYDNSNSNVCNQAIGRCFCDYYTWMGIACDIRVPSYGSLELLYNAITIDPDDPNEVCSQAGRISPNRTTFGYQVTWNIRITVSLQLCDCMPGFEGTPADPNTFVPMYASLFHSTAAAKVVSRQNINNNADSFNAQEWFSENTSPQFQSDQGRVFPAWDLSQWTDYTAGGTEQKIAFQWQFYILMHQCLIWKQPAIIPPLNVNWDYQSFPFALPAPAEHMYRTQRVVYPWPPISLTDRNGRRGIRCMDYDEFDCSQNDASRALICDFLNYLYYGPFDLTADPWAQTGITKTRLYGGDNCDPCPACDRAHSTCVSNYDHVATVFTTGGCKLTVLATINLVDYKNFPNNLFVTDDQRRNNWVYWLQSAGLTAYIVTCTSPCITNKDAVYPSQYNDHIKMSFTNDPTQYCTATMQAGPTVCKCDANFCGAICNRQICPVADNQPCGHGKCVLDASVICDSFVGDFPGTCKCDNGWEGTVCDQPICPFDPQGNMCGHGTCDVTSRTCHCDSSQFGGSACWEQGCPHSANGYECNNAIRLDNSQTVCNRVTGLCECFRTVSSADFSQIRLGWTSTDTAIHSTGLYGVACESTYTSVCMNLQSRLWCSQGINDGVFSPGYAGCYNQTCLAMGSAAGLDCTPSCKCTPEYALSKYCEQSICGTSGCGPGGTCIVTCFNPNTPGITQPCFGDKIAKGLMGVKGECLCGVSGNQYYTSKIKGGPCTIAAPTCFTGTTSPCNQNGDCVWNSTAFVCHCDAGHFGTQCEVTPNCTTPLGDACNDCVHPTGPTSQPVCVCPFGTLRDANRTCTQERCVSTGGTYASGNETCICPGGIEHPFYAIPDILDLYSTQTDLGCRKGCPVFDDTFTECGSLETIIDGNGDSVKRSRCIDIMNGDPIYRDDVRVAPVCNCSFFGLDQSGFSNYFISDGQGGCKPKCDPTGLCIPGSTCNADRVDPVTLACNCVGGRTSSDCSLSSCSGFHTIGTTGACVCRVWCRGGVNCEIDTCAASGGTCIGDTPNDCDCSNPILKLNNSMVTQRTCMPMCMNGGVPSLDFSRCVCPDPYIGTLCDLQRFCSIQYRGVFCNISLCVNGTPKPNDQVGCNCPDSFYQGQLCDTDVCTGKRRKRQGGVCVCQLGWTGDSCIETTCAPGGEPDSNGLCKCFPGYNRTIDNIGCSIVVTPCVNGVIETNFDGTIVCKCTKGYNGSDCSQLACPPQLIALNTAYTDNSVVCGCPLTFHGPNCDETLCNEGVGTFNNLTGLTECPCSVGETLSLVADAYGAQQCIPDPYVCDEFGTVGWSNVFNNVPCVCKVGYSGTRCQSLSTVSTSESSSSISTTTIAIIVASSVSALAVVGGAYYCFKKEPWKKPTKMRHRRPNHLFDHL